MLVYPITINWRLRWVEKYRAVHHHLNDLAGSLRKVKALLKGAVGNLSNLFGHPIAILQCLLSQMLYEDICSG